MAIALPGDNEVRFRLRPDLQFSEYQIGISNQLVVKDPVKLEYFLFEPFEHLLLKQLNEPKSAEEIKRCIEKEMTGKNVLLDDIRMFLQRLFSDNLVLTDTNTNGMALWQMQKKQKRHAAWQMATGILAIRFKGADPQKFLDCLNPYAKFLFQPFFIFAATVAFSLSVLAMLLNIERIFESAFLWEQLYRAETLVLVGLAVMVVKVLHELGHALACRSIDRNCHEIGVLLLAFVPCLYCNVSDVWMEPKKWKRMLVSAAGIYVEMLVAAVCVPLWLFSNEGSLQIFWLSMISICTINTLLINGNPLLRYDGYYFLSDWLEVPNLYSESQKRISRRIQSWFFKGARTEEAYSLLELYGAMAFVYRYFILAVIFSAVYLFFERIELGNIGVLVTSLLAILTFGGAVMLTFQRLKISNWRGIKMGPVALFLVVVVSVILASIFVTTTPRIFAEGQVGAVGNAIVFAPESGKIEWLAEPGQNVVKGEAVAKVSNVKLQWKIMEQDQLAQQLQLELKNLELIQSNSGDDNSAEIELTKDALSSARKIRNSLIRQLSDLEIESAENGELLMLPQQKSSYADQLDLDRKTSTLQGQNQDASVSAGEPIAIVVNQDNLVINLEVAEKVVRYIKVGQSVKLLVAQYSNEYHWGTVCAVLDSTTFSMGHDDESNAQKNGNVVVQVKCRDMQAPFYQSRASAIILADPISWYDLAWRKINQNFDY